MILPPLEALVANGDGQYGTVGSVVQIPLQVIVREVESQRPRNGMAVQWSVDQGAASLETIATTITDETGSASVRVRLGASTGEVVVRARVVEQDNATATFRLFTVNRPTLAAVVPTSADPGQSITLTGTDFSPDPDQNVVLFSGIRGFVSAATATELTVEVPACLPRRTVGVTVQLGTVASDSQPLTIQTAGTETPLAVGEYVDADPGSFSCVTVSGDDGARYLTIVQSASPIGAATYPWQLVGVGGQSTPFAAAWRDESASTAARAAGEARPYVPGTGGHADRQAMFDYHLREMEKREGAAWIARAAPAGVSSVTGPAAIPTLDERRTFQVYQPTGFVEVTAVARYVGERAALFVDEAAPAGGYDAADLQRFSDQFDDVIYPEVTGLFGGVSDLDSNQRIVILFTPAVNALTDRGDTGFIAGFFYGVDLMSGSPGSNEGEIFYSVVPDPTGQVSDPRSKEDLLEVTPAILAHEFQHMVGYNERVLIRGGEPRDATWLSEGLAQYAEVLVARRYAELGDAGTEETFQQGVRNRSRLYLADPASVSVVISSGQGTLEERGASFLNVVYLAERFGENLVARLTRTTSIGVEAVVEETGTPWADVLSDWWSAVYLDGSGPEGPLSYGDVDLRGFLGPPFPLTPAPRAGGDLLETGSLPSSAAAYYIVTPGVSSSTTFRLGGSGGAGSIGQGVMRMRILRVN